MDYSKYTSLKVEKRDRIALVTVDRPDIENQIDEGMHRELESIWRDLAGDKEVNVVLLTGVGSHFIGTAYVPWIERAILRHDKSVYRIGPKAVTGVLKDMLEVPQPIIAAVNGDAWGFGATVTLYCDFIIAAEGARICDAHVSDWGLVAGDGGVPIWPLRVGLTRAKEYLITGDPVSATEAERIGLINRVVPAGQLMPAATALAERLANGPQQAIRGTKLCLNKLVKEEMNLLQDLALSLELRSMTLADHREAVLAKVERRSPRWSGR